MVKKKRIAVFAAVGAVTGVFGYQTRKYIKEKKKTEKTKESEKPNEQIVPYKKGFYERYIKRPLDIICALLAIICFCWLYAIIAILVKIKLGSPILFKQMRPGLN